MTDTTLDDETVETTERPRHPNRLAELRDRRQLSQSDIAKLLGMTAATVNRHERGNRALDGFAIERYAKFYGVSPYEIFVPAESWVPFVPAPYEPPSVAEDVKAIIERNRMLD